MTEIETAIYAAAFVDAFREVFIDEPLVRRRELAAREAAFVVQQWRLARGPGVGEESTP